MLLKFIRSQPVVLFVCLFAMKFAAAQAQSSQAQPAPIQTIIVFDRKKVFDEVCTIVQREFYKPDLGGNNWPKLEAEFRPQALNAQSHDKFAELIHQMLGGLKTSHTAYFSTQNPKRYELLGIFEAVARPLINDEDPFASDPWVYEGIGIDHEVRNGKTFVRSVYDGLPAAKADIRFGDEIVSVDNKPFHPIQSFYHKTGKTVDVALRRKQDAAPLLVKVTVEGLDGKEMFLQALEASSRIELRGSKKIGYLHVWSYAGEKYHDFVRQEILFGKLADCDSLVLDLRDGWGGANFEYLNLFRPSILEMKSVQRNGTTILNRGAWEKPVVLLINNRSTSGKEVFAYGFKKHSLGKIVGENTAGAVVAGRPFVLSSGDVLYLAVADVQVDGKRLEQIGVAPDIQVDRPLEYAAGRDPQLERAFETLAK
ncbi:MAG: S41 family peptidase [Pirellulales bacterium]